MNKKSLSLLLIVLLISLLVPGYSYAEVTSNYLNPVMPGADPTIVRDADGYYYSCFSAGDGIYLKKHEIILGVVTAKNKRIWVRPAGSGNIYGYVWGPYIYRLDGKWYIYFSAGAPNDFGHPYSYCLENSSPDPFEGTWTEKGKINTQSNGLACGVVNLDGKRYFTYTKYYWNAAGDKFDESPTLVEMSNPWTLKGTEGKVAYPIYPWEKHGDSIDEGCAVVERDGKIYFAYSASSYTNDNYCVGVSTALSGSDLLNPASWIKHPEPVMSKSPENSVFGPGSPLFVKSEDGTEDWLIYHGGPVSGRTGTQRWVRAQRINWNDDGFINLGIPSNANTVLTRPSGEEKSEMYEAENALSSGAGKIIVNASSNCSGSGYMKYNNAAGDYVEFTVNTKTAGNYSLNFRYNNSTSSAIPMILKVNQGSNSTISFPSNAGSSSNYDYVRVNNIKLNAGSNKVRLTVNGISGLSLDVLVAKRSTLYEAEDSDLFGGASAATDHEGYSGTGFVAGLWNKGAAAQFTVNAPYAGNYSVNLRYGNGSSADQTMSLYVNGVKVKQIQLFKQNSWNKWADRIDNITLNAGNNTITYQYDSSDSGNVNLDHITVTDTITWHYEAENAALSGSAAKDAEHPNYTGTGFVKGFTSIGAAAGFSVNVEDAASYDVKLRYSNGNTDSKTLSLYLNGSKVKQISLSKTGSWSAWSEELETLSLNAGNNVIEYKYDSGDSGKVNIDSIHLNKRIPWKYQAEDAALSGGAAVDTEHLWYDGTGFVDGFWNQGASAQFNVNVPNTASYTATLRYSGKSSGKLSLYVNGSKIKQISLPATASWDAWAESTETVSLKAGNNVIAYKYDTGDTGNVNLDCITIDKNSGGNPGLNNSGIVSGRTYKITAKHSGKSLDVSNYSSDEGAIVHQWSYKGGNNQKWRIEDLGTGYYKIISVHSGLVLDVLECSTADGAQVHQWSYVGGESQQWKIENAGGYYKITNRNSGKVLDVSEISSKDGAEVHQWSYEGLNNQLWKIEIP